jgi:hypothetical protein
VEDYTINIMSLSVQCNAPEDQSESDHSATSVSLGWTETGDAESWQLRLGVAGFDTTGVTPVTVTTNPYLWSGLSKNTSYDWYVRAVCNGGSYSEWTGPHTFSTLACDITSVTLPYLQGFELSNGTVQYGGTVCASDFYWTYNNNNPGKGRLRYGTYSPIANSGNGAVTMDRTPDGTNNINYLTLTLDMSDYSDKESGILLSFSWAHFNEELDDNDRVWVRGSVADEWVEVYSFDPSTGPAQVFNDVSGLDIATALFS